MQCNSSGSDAGDSRFVRSAGKGNAFSSTAPGWSIQHSSHMATSIYSASISAVTMTSMDDSLSLYEDYRRRRSMPLEDLLSHGTVQTLLKFSPDTNPSMPGTSLPSTYSHPPSARYADPQQPFPSTLSGLGHRQTRYLPSIRPSALRSGAKQEPAKRFTYFPLSTPVTPTTSLDLAKSTATDKSPFRGDGSGDASAQETSPPIPATETVSVDRVTHRPNIWQRFARKGGIGKARALYDRITGGHEFLSLKKDDEIVVLLPIPDRENNYLGSHDGTLGIFAGSNVQFLGPLKKPIKRLRVPRGSENYRPSMQMNNDVSAPLEDAAPTHQPTANEPESMGPDNDAQAQRWTEGHEGEQWGHAQPAHEDHPPAPAASAAEDAESAHQASPNEPDFMGPDTAAQAQPFTSSSRVQYHEDESWKPAQPAHEDHPPAATFTRGPDEGLTREGFPIDLVDPDELHPSATRPPRHSGPRMKPPRPGCESPSSAAMFTNAQVDINGGTFHNVAHVYESDAPACGGGSALQRTALGLQAVSLATHGLHFLQFDHPLDPPPVMASPSTVYVALSFPSLYNDMKIMVGPLTLWLVIKMWIQRRAIEHH